MPVTSHSIDHITCIACGQNIDADQFSINIHRQAHRQAEHQLRTEVWDSARRQIAEAKKEARDLRLFLRWVQDDIDELIGTREGEEED